MEVGLLSGSSGAGSVTVRAFGWAVYVRGDPQKWVKRGLILLYMMLRRLCGVVFWGWKWRRGGKTLTFG